MKHKLTFKGIATAMIAASLLQAACTSSTNKNSMNTTSTTGQLPAADAFNNTEDGKEVNLFYLKNDSGMQAAITNFGGRVVSLLVPSASGNVIDVVVGLKDVDAYTDKNAASAYYGALIGRYGNRIANGKFNLEGKSYSIPVNNGPNALHGGKKGFDSHIWNAKQTDARTLELTYVSADGEEGFPGKLTTKVIYELTNDNALKITYEATTDKPTVLNLTNHSYFNLNGAGSGSILEHTLKIDADQFTPVNDKLIPTGQLQNVENTPFDFRKASSIGSRINEGDPQLMNGKGYDHNFVLRKHDVQTPVISVQGDKSHIRMEVLTDQPGVQFYSGNFMQGNNTLLNGAKDGHRTAFALETQHYPDSPNQPSFPTTELKPGQTYKTTTSYKFYKQ